MVVPCRAIDHRPWEHGHDPASSVARVRRHDQGADGRGLESPEALEDDQGAARAANRTDPRRRGQAGWFLGLGVAIIVVGTLFVERQRGDAPVVVVDGSVSALPEPTTTTIPPRRMEGRLVALLGDKLVASPSALLGLIGPARGPGPVMAVAGGRVLVQGVGAGEDRRAGTWSFDPAARRKAVFLGASTSFAPAEDPGRVWLAQGPTVRLVRNDGTVAIGPMALPGTLIGRVGAGLVLQRGNHVLWWRPGDNAPKRDLGVGRAVDAAGARALWIASRGELVLTDPVNGHSFTPVLERAPITTAVLSPDGSRYAAAFPAAVRVGSPAGPNFDVPVSGATRLAWAGNDLVVAASSKGLLTSIDAHTGAVRLLGRLPVAPSALGIVLDEAHPR